MQNQAEHPEVAGSHCFFSYSRFGIKEKFIRPSAAIAFAIVALIAATNADSAERPVYEATYAIDLNGIDIGTGKRLVSTAENRIAISKHVLSPQGLAVLLGESGYSDTTRINLADPQFQPVKATRDGGRDSYSAEFRLSERTVVFSDGNVFRYPDYAVYDIESLTMLLMLAPGSLKVGDRIALLERLNRVRNYEIADVGRDNLTLNGSQISTLRYSLRGVEDVSRGYSLWISPDSHNLLVQMIRHKKSDDLRATLINFRNLASSGD